MTWSSWSFYLSDLFTLSLQESVNHIFGFSTPVLVPTEVSGLWVFAPISCGPLYLPVCLFNLGGYGLLCDFSDRSKKCC